jgi:hypothetical protein
MSRYPLEAIRSLRLRKQDEAERKLAAARLVEEQRKKEVNNAEKALQDYLLWMKQEADRLFSTIVGALNPIHKVTDITNQITWNRNHQSTYVVALDEVKKKLQEAQAETASCLKEQEKAYKEVWKINQHREIWLKEAALQEERDEEAELEEVAATIFAMH